MLPLDEIADFATGQTVQGFATTFASVTMHMTGQIVLPIFIAISAFGGVTGGLVCSSVDLTSSHLYRIL